MDTFLAQLLGLYFVIFGVVSLFSQRTLVPAVKALTSNRAYVLVLAILELAAGLAIVLAYTEVSFSLAGAISLIGWVMVIEGVLYMVLPFTFIRRFIKKFNTPLWYRAGGILSIVLGAYLALSGFGYLA